MLINTLFLADAAAGFTPEQVAALVIAIIAALGGGGFLGKKIADAKRVRVTPTPFPINLEEPLATKKELEALEERLGAELAKIEAALAKERDVARTANGNLHARIDRTTEALAEVRGELRQMNENLRSLLEKALKPGTR